MRRLRGRLVQTGGALTLAAASLLAGGCGDGDEPAGLASMVPPDAPLFAEAVVRPEGDQAEAIESFADRVGNLSDPGAAVVAALDRELADQGLELTYADDVEPWLGDRAAIFVRSFEDTEVPAGADAAILAEVADADAAREFVAKAFEPDPQAERTRSYRGTEYQYSNESGGTAVGVIDDSALAVGTETAFKVAVDASDGESLAASEEYVDRVEPLPDDPLATLFIEPGTAIEAAIASEGVAPGEGRMVESLLPDLISQPIAATLTATTESATVDLAAMLAGGARVTTESPLLDGLPGGSWFAAAVPELGPTLERTVDRLSTSGLPGARRLERQIRTETGLDLGSDVLDWLGDAAAFVQGTGVPGFSAGLIAETSDPESPRALLDAVRRIAERDSGLRSVGPPEGAEYGFSIGLPGLGGGAEAGVIDDMLVGVIGSTAQLALHPDRTLGDDGRFQDAVASLGDDVAPVLYLYLPSFFDVAQQGDDDGDPDYAALGPYLDAFESLVGGARADAGLLLSRGTVTLAPE